MIYLYEQYGYKRTGYKEITDKQCSILDSSSIKSNKYKKTVLRQKSNQMCVQIDFDQEKEKYHFETSYFVGVDWILENRLPIYVQPKLNKEDIQINYFQMLLDAITEPDNIKNIDGLLNIDFNKPCITIKQSEDLLSPFLIIQFLQILQTIVRKGLKKSYYSITNNLEAKVKGKILVSKTIRGNIIKGQLTKTICRYDEFGVNCDENKILKKAYLFACKAIENYKELDIEELQHIKSYIHPAFENISEDIKVDKIKAFKPNPIYKEYEQAIKLALLILKRFSYNIDQTENQLISTPPFWIDMSKLFELYVYKKLKNAFPNKNEVQYHSKINYLELDFLLKAKDSNDNDCMFVIDTKYKPKYHEDHVNIEDIRQVCGYARLEQVYQKLEISDYNKNINCLIIYSHQNCETSFDNNDFIFQKDNLGLKGIRKEKHYVNFYKLGIKLPEIKPIEQH